MTCQNRQRFTGLNIVISCIKAIIQYNDSVPVLLLKELLFVHAFLLHAFHPYLYWCASLVEHYFIT